MYDLINIFEIFLPQLLLYPNPTDPLNAEAAALQLKSPEKFNEKVKTYVQRFAQASKQKKEEEQKQSQPTQKTQEEAKNIPENVARADLSAKAKTEDDATSELELLELE